MGMLLGRDLTPAPETYTTRSEYSEYNESESQTLMNVMTFLPL